MELVSSRDEFPFFKNFTRSPSLISPLSHPLSSLLSPMWQKLLYICNNFFYYSNLRITFLNYCTIEKSPLILSFGWWHGNELDLCFFIDLAYLLRAISIWDFEGCYVVGLGFLLNFMIWASDLCVLGLFIYWISNLVVNLGLFIKLCLNYKILNLDLIGFILVTHLC